MRLGDRIELARGAYRVGLSAAAGARLTALTWNDGHNDHDLLVPCDTSASFDPHDWPKCGAFPMAPFTNKLADGRFSWNEREITVPTATGSPHAMHGLVHRMAWEVAAVSDDRALLEYRHQPGDEGWPWAFETTLEVDVSERGVQVDLRIRNVSNEAMPAGLGWHPFHPACRAADARSDLTLIAAVPRDVGPDGLAILLPSDVGTSEPSRRSCRIEPQTTVFEHWAGELSVLIEENVELHIEVAGAPHLFCHVPQHARHLCLEPVTLLPGALRNYGAELRASQVALAPGATRALRWSCSARRPEGM